MAAVAANYEEADHFEVALDSDAPAYVADTEEWPGTYIQRLIDREEQDYLLPLVVFPRGTPPHRADPVSSIRV